MYSSWYLDEYLGLCPADTYLSRNTLLRVWLTRDTTRFPQVFQVFAIVKSWNSKAFEFIDLSSSLSEEDSCRDWFTFNTTDFFSHPPSPSCDELGVGIWYTSINQPSSATFALWKYYMSLSCYIILPAQYLISSLLIVAVHDKTKAWWVFPPDLRA